MEISGNNKILQSERDDYKRRGPIVEGKLKESFSVTALVEDRPFTEADIEALRTAYLEVAPFAYNKVYPSYWEHCLYSSMLARRLTEQVKQIQLEPLEAEALAFIGDDGSIVVPHRYARKNIVSDIFDKDIGIRKDLLRKQPPVLGILGIKVVGFNKQEVHSLDDLSLPQIMMDVADNLGKINVDGRPRMTREAIEYSRNQLRIYDGGVFPSERRGLSALTEKGKGEFATNLLEKEISYLRNKFGVDIDAVIQSAYQEYSSEPNQQWLLEVKQAQESLAPETDELLNRPSIQTVVFDAGGVLMKDPDPALFNLLANFFDCSYGKIVESMNELNPDAFSNKISEVKYLKKFWKKMGKTCPSEIDLARKPFIHPEIYQPMEGMQEIIKRLSENSNIQLCVLSDSIHVVTPAVLSWIRGIYPQIPENHIFISSLIRASKKDEGSTAFKVMLEKLGVKDPQAVIFIDDRESYSTVARAEYDMRSMRFAVNDPSRLKSEFERAKLI